MAKKSPDKSARPAKLSIGKKKSSKTLEPQTEQKAQAPSDAVILTQIQSLISTRESAGPQPPRVVVPYLPLEHWQAMQGPEFLAEPHAQTFDNPYGDAFSEDVAVWMQGATQNHLGLHRADFPTMILTAGASLVWQTPEPGSDPPPPNRCMLLWEQWLLIQGGDLDPETTLVHKEGNIYLLVAVTNTAWGTRLMPLKIVP